MHLDNSGVQPREPQPAHVPRRRRRVRRRGLQGTRSRSCSPRRRSSSATPTTRPRRSPRRHGASVSSASATRTSARCSWRSGFPTTPTTGRAWAGALTALMTGHAYATSARTAARMGPFAGLHRERRAHAPRAAHAPGRGGEDRRGARASVVARCRAAVVGRRASSSPSSTACATRRRACSRRPARSRFLMDCDTTGIEPDLGLVKTKKLVGGGTMSIVNQTCPVRSRSLGYTQFQIDSIVAYIDEQHVDRRCARTSRPSTSRCSPARWATTSSTTWATCG